MNLKNLAIAFVLLLASVSAAYAQPVTYTPGNPNPPDVFAPPAPYTINSVASSDTSVLISTIYSKVLELTSMEDECNKNNSLAFVKFKNDYANFIVQSQNSSAPVAAPDHPVYENVDSFEAYWTALTTDSRGGRAFNSEVTPQQFHLPGGVGLVFVTFAHTELVPASATSGSPADPVGIYIGGGYYACVVGDSLPDGATYTDTSKLYTKHLNKTPFGTECGWTAVSLSK